MQKIIFTDLDGTLLNHCDYRFDDAKEALTRIGQHGYPLIIVSSKTAEEIKKLQNKLGLCEPFICENGAAILYPSQYEKLGNPAGETEGGYKKIVLGATYDELVSFLNTFKKPLGIRGFSDMDAEEIAEFTGLGLEGALFAKRRQYTEPFIIKDETLIDILIPEAERAGYSITRGGRFFHLKKAGSDKGVAVRRVLELFESYTGERVTSYALGDSDNDREMLEIVDIPLVVRKEDGSCLEGFPRCSKSPGSKGWNELVMGVVFDG
jgi:mannosyl-3-phosphoglycerate phosphatase